MNQINLSVTSYKINKIEKQKDSVISNYLEELRNANKLKKPYIRSRKMTDIACNLIDTKEFKIQIEELLQNNLIKLSFSPHRSSTFLVRNHNEQKRGKVRIVINYKRLNDNTYGDAYKIPNKDSLINFIQGCKYFSELDCKNGF